MREVACVLNCLKNFVLQISIEYVYNKLELNTMSDAVYQFFIQQFIRFAGYEIKRKSSISNRSLQASAIFYFHECL